MQTTYEKARNVETAIIEKPEKAYPASMAEEPSSSATASKEVEEEQ